MPTTIDNLKNRKANRPKLMLVGSFNDFFLEALKDLDFEFILHKSSKPNLVHQADVIVIAYDRTDEALEYVKKFKVVPVMFAGSRNFSDYNAVTEQGNSFLYKKNTLWHMLEAVLRASETYKFGYDWKNLCAEVKDTAKFAVKNVV